MTHTGEAFECTFEDAMAEMQKIMDHGTDKASAFRVIELTIGMAMKAAQDAEMPPLAFLAYVAECVSKTTSIDFEILRSLTTKPEEMN